MFCCHAGKVDIFIQFINDIMRTVMGVTFILVKCSGIGKGNCGGGNCVKEASSGTGHIV